MWKLLLVPLVLGASASLSACLPMMAASAVGMAAKGMRGTPTPNAHLMPTAEAACSAQAATHGTVKIIDVQQKSVGLIIVWGTAGEGQQRRSFECHYTTKIASFRLREIKAAN